MSVFTKGASIAFKIAKKLGLITSITFNSISDNGIDIPVVTSVTVDAIKERFIQDDFRGLIFRDKIQPTDIKLLVEGTKIANVDTNDTVIIDSITYTVFGCQIDAAHALWIIGVR